MLFLTQALAKNSANQEVQIIVVTNNLHNVTGEENICPEKATILGACKVINQEFAHLNCRHIDIVIPQQVDKKRELLAQITNEFTSDFKEFIISYRGKHRWIQTFEKIQLETENLDKFPLQKSGVYLITGGLGGIGLTLAKYLAQTVKAKLILIGRSPFPHRESWEQWLQEHDNKDIVSQKIKKIQELEKFGAEVLVCSADITSLTQMQTIKEKILTKFGKINGVIHAAGVPGGGIIQLKTSTAAAKVLAPKVKGTVVLNSVFCDDKLDLFVLCSSLASITGGLAQIDYCAANAFLDGFAQSKSLSQKPLTIAINWCGWQEVGMLVNTTIPEELKSSREQDLNMAISPENGVEVFRRILHSQLPQVAVCKQNLNEQIERSYAVNLVTELNNLEKQSSQIKFAQKLHPRPQLNNPYVAPRTEIEKKIADLWQQLLGLEQIGIYDNFFDLGGHSLLATQVISRLRTTLKVELPLYQLFEAPTIGEQANIIQQLQSEDVQPSSNTTSKLNRDNIADLKFKLPKIQKASRLGNIPLSYAQQRLWYIDQLQPNNTAYNIFIPLRVSGFLDIPTLELCLNEIIRRHEILRTNFIVDNGQPIQVITSSLNLELPIIDLSKLSDTEREQTIQSLVTQEAEKPFNLDTNQLLRVALLHLSETEYVLLFTMHHIISDGWSVEVLIKELLTLYEAYSLGEVSPLPELPIQYADFAIWQRQWLQGEILEQLLSYWKKQLENLPTLKLPTDYPRSLTPTYQGSAQTFTISSTLSQQIKTLSNQQGVTLFMTLQAAFATLMHYYSEQDDIVIGTDIANRNQGETEGLIGFFVNQLVLRTKFNRNSTFCELLDKVREVNLDAYAHQDLPFDILVNALNPERHLNISPLFQVKFIFNNTQTPKLEIPNLTIDSIPISKNTTQIDLMMILGESQQSIVTKLEYSTDIFAPETIAQMLKSWEIILNQIVANPHIKLQELINAIAAAMEEEKQLQKTEHKQNMQQKLKKIKRKTIKDVSP